MKMKNIMSMRESLRLSLIIMFLVSVACTPAESSQDIDDVIDTIVDGYEFGYEEWDSIICQGTYEQHLQGISVDEVGNIFWSFTTDLVKTDPKGKVLHTTTVAYHHGDLDVRDGKVYVAVGFGRWNHEDGLADSWVYVYDAETLHEIERIPVPEVVYGAGGIIKKENQFYVVGGLPNSVQENYIYVYDEYFNFVNRKVLETGHTDLGIQTIAYHDGQWWLGTYGANKLYQLDNHFEVIAKYPIDVSLGIVSLSATEILVGTNQDTGAGFVGKATRFVKKTK